MLHFVVAYLCLMLTTLEPLTAASVSGCTIERKIMEQGSFVKHLRNLGTLGIRPWLLMRSLFIGMKIHYISANVTQMQKMPGQYYISQRSRVSPSLSTTPMTDHWQNSFSFIAHYFLCGLMTLANPLQISATMSSRAKTASSAGQNISLPATVSSAS
jgi:hypothetical protein